MTVLRAKPGSSLLSRIQSKVFGKKLRRRALRAALLLGNVALLVAVVAVVVLNPVHTSGSAAPAATSDQQAAAQPVDQLASVDIAVTVARMTNLPEAPAVTNLADSENIQLSLASANDTVVNKPQTVTSTFISNKYIHHYTARSGDTVTSIANKFGVSTDSVLWSNGLTSDYLVTGTPLVIPPVNGIVYTVRSGDTPSSLAAKYHSDAQKIIAYNDAELSGLRVGEEVLIPNGQIAAAVQYTYGYGFAWGTGAIYGFNGYDYGNCTWYVATQIAIPANWGNAATWAAGARAAGWHVSSTPTVGAIAQTAYGAGGLGHVGIVVAINGDQIEIRDMNNYGDGGGYGRVGEGWVPVTTYQNFITR